MAWRCWSWARTGGRYRFQSSNAYVRHTLAERFDAAPDGPAPNLFNQHNRTEMLTSETRVWRPVQDGLGWLVGFSAVSNSTEQHRSFEQSIGAAVSPGVTNEITEFTAYGKISVEPWRGLILGAGGRVTHSRLGGGAEDVQPTLVAAGAEITARRTENEVLPSADALLRVTPQLALFARYEEGFRPGGLAFEGNFVRRFRNDHVANWEVGARWGGPGSTVAATVSVAHSDWRDIQADFIDSNGLPTTANIGDGRITSVAATLALRPAARLRIDLSAVYNHSRVVSLSPEVAALPSSVPLKLPVTGPLVGLPIFGTIGAFGPGSGIAKIPNVADQAVQGSFDYRMPLGRNALRLGGWAKYIGPSRPRHRTPSGRRAGRLCRHRPRRAPGRRMARRHIDRDQPFRRQGQPLRARNTLRHGQWRLHHPPAPAHGQSGGGLPILSPAGGIPDSGKWCRLGDSNTDPRITKTGQSSGKIE